MLDEFENVMTTLAITKILKDGFSIKSKFDVFCIHRLIFSEVYYWAGIARKINLFKSEQVLDGISVNYSSHEKIDIEIKTLDKAYKNIMWKKLEFVEYVEKIIKYISTLWQIHPFREGNTRTIATFLFFKLEQDGYNLNLKFLKEHSIYFRNALVLASIGKYSEYEHLEEFIKDAISGKGITFKKTDNRDSKYNKIKELDLSDYKFNYHEVE